VARRLRGKLAENRISGAELARRLNTTQALISRRTAGHVAFELDELDEIEKVTGISADYLWSGRE
jgi:transcriptional regulator with XRE-family HTH domain